MRRILPALAVLAAVAVLVAAGALLLRTGASEPAPPPPRPAPPPTSPRPRGAPVFPPDDGPSPPPRPATPVPPPAAPDAYPWEVPGWWHEIDRKFRDREVAWEAETLTVQEILGRLEREAGFPVRAGPGLEDWAAENRIALASVHGPARAVVEALATRLNLDAVITADAFVLYQRGRAPDTALVRAARVQTAILEARERREGKRPLTDEATDVRGEKVAAAFDRTPLREAARRIGEELGIPVYMDAALWSVNPSVTTPEGGSTLGEILDRTLAPLGAASDVTPRRIVLFKP